MVFRTLIGLIVSIFISVGACADEVQLNPSHPDQYTVVKGDTLWDISGKFLTHPWQWPELWSYNSQIENPHLIYPGDTVYFSMVNGKPQLSLSRSSPQSGADSPCVLGRDYKHGRKNFACRKTGRYCPVFETDIKQAINCSPWP
jgi:hypothetical protein